MRGTRWRNRPGTSYNNAAGKYTLAHEDYVVHSRSAPINVELLMEPISEEDDEGNPFDDELDILPFVHAYSRTVVDIIAGDSRSNPIVID